MLSFLEPEDVRFGFSPSCLENIGSIGSQFNDYDESSSQSSNCSGQDDQSDFFLMQPVPDSVDQMSAALAAVSAEMLENSTKLDTVSHKLGLVEMEQNFFSKSFSVNIDTLAIEKELCNDNFFFNDCFLKDESLTHLVQFPVGSAVLESPGAVICDQNVVSAPIDDSSADVFENQDNFLASAIDSSSAVSVFENQDNFLASAIDSSAAVSVFENQDNFLDVIPAVDHSVSENQDAFPLFNNEFIDEDIGDNVLNAQKTIFQERADELDDEEELIKRLAALNELFANFSRQSEEGLDFLADDVSVDEQDMEIAEAFVETEQDAKEPVVQNQVVMDKEPVKFVEKVSKAQSFSVWLPLQRIEKRDFVDKCPVFFEVKTTESDELLQKIFSAQNFDIGLQNKELLSGVLKGEIINELVERSSRLKKKKIGETYDTIRRAMGVKLTNRRFQQLRSLGNIKDILQVNVFHYTCPVSEIIDRAPAILKESLQKATEKKRKSSTEARPPPPKKPRTKCCPAVRVRQ
jgi:hypothetical protein